MILQLKQRRVETSSRTTSAFEASTLPKLAVVISCFNYAEFIERAVRSVLDQRCDDCELVVVDDGSTDNSWDIIRATGATAFRVSNGGQRMACLFGLDHTRAPFVLFLDADDELAPGSLDVIIRQLDPAVAKLQFPLALIDKDGNQLNTASSLKAFRTRDRLARQVLKSGVYRTPPTSGNVFRRDVCEFLREAEYDHAVDGVILFVAPLLGDVVSLADKLGRYRIHSRNDSGRGRTPDAHTLERDIERFLERMEHLRVIIRRLPLDARLVDARKTFYFLERTFWLDIASGKRPPMMALPRRIFTLAGQPFSLKNKIAIAAFFVLGSVLPCDKSKALLAYRLRSGHRSAFGFAREIFG